MLKNLILTSAVILLTGLVALGQATPAKASLVAGEITAIADKKITINTTNGAVDVILSDKTEFKRTPADKPSLATATAAALTDASVGDKVVVSGFPSADGKTIQPRTVYLMTKSDIAQKHAKEAEEWRRRGMKGKVLSVNSDVNQMTVEVTALTGTATKVTLTPKADAKFKRYAQDSVKYDEAKDSSLAEIKTGDMIRALGDKSSDGTAFAAEEIVSGAFQTVAGTVKSIDVAKNEVVIKNLATNKDTTIVIGDGSVVKRYPQEMAERFASFQMGGNGPRPVGQGGPPQGGRPQGGERPAGGGGEGRQFPGGGQGRVGFGGGRPGGGTSVDDMLDGFPNITVADLKVGDMVALSSTKNATNDRIKAIKLLAGVEPFLRMAQGAGGGGRGRGGQGGVDGGFSIPGLDGIGFP